MNFTTHFFQTSGARYAIYFLVNYNTPFPTLLFNLNESFVSGCDVLRVSWGSVKIGTVGQEFGWSRVPTLIALMM